MGKFKKMLKRTGQFERLAKDCGTRNVPIKHQTEDMWYKELAFHCDRDTLSWDTKLFYDIFELSREEYVANAFSKIPTRVKTQSFLYRCLNNKDIEPWIVKGTLDNNPLSVGLIVGFPMTVADWRQYANRYKDTDMSTNVRGSIPAEIHICDRPCVHAKCRRSGLSSNK